MNFIRLGAGVAAAALLCACSGTSGGNGASAGPAGYVPLMRSTAVQPAAGQSVLYVADQFNQRVAIFKQSGGGNPAPIGQITDGISGPDGLFVDSHGTLYVCNFGAGTVTEYPAGQTSPSKTLTGTVGPKYVTAGRDGTVYVSDFDSGSNGKVYEYAGGSTTPTASIPVPPYPAGVALDAHNRLYVTYGNRPMLESRVEEIAAMRDVDVIAAAIQAVRAIGR